MEDLTRFRFIKIRHSHGKSSIPVSLGFITHQNPPVTWFSGSNGFYDATSQSCKLACPAGQFKDQSWYSPRCSTCGTNALTCDGNGQALTWCAFSSSSYHRPVQYFNHYSCNSAAGTVLSNGICVSAILQSGSGFTYTGCFGDYSRGPHLLSKFILQAATVTDCLSACKFVTSFIILTFGISSSKTRFHLSFLRRAR